MVLWIHEFERSCLTPLQSQILQDRVVTTVTTLLYAPQFQLTSFQMTRRTRANNP